MRKSKTTYELEIMLMKLKAHEMRLYELRIEELEKRLDEKSAKVDRLLRA